MTHQEWVKRMGFPSQWVSWGLLPDELVAIQLAGYAPGHEDAPEHDRHGALQWWLRQEPPKDILLKLARLTWLDPDPPMAQYVRECIARARDCDEDVQRALVEPYAP
jgi:hypothetical protein